MTEKVIVKDQGDIIEITYDDILKYHGRQMIGGAALAFKIMLMTFPELCDDIPERGHFSFYSGIGKNGRGIIDAAEMVMRVKTYDSIRLDTEYSEDKLGQVAPGGGRYYFEIGYICTLPWMLDTVFDKRSYRFLTIVVGVCFMGFFTYANMIR